MRASLLKIPELMDLEAGQGAFAEQVAELPELPLPIFRRAVENMRLSSLYV